MATNVENGKFTLGLDVGLFGRWVRLITGSVVPIVSIIYMFATNKPSLSFYGEAGLYFVGIFAIYLAAHFFLGERLLARANPWVGAILLVGPPVVILIFGLGPNPFQLALALYIAISLTFNFVMSYGGCEVMALPSLIFRRRYTVYCPYNVVDVLDKVIADRKLRIATAQG